MYICTCAYLSGGSGHHTSPYIEGHAGQLMRVGVADPLCSCLARRVQGHQILQSHTEFHAYIISQ